MSARTCLQWFDWNGQEEASSCAQWGLTSLRKSTIEERGRSVLPRGQLEALQWYHCWSPLQSHSSEWDPEVIRPMASPCPLSAYTAPCPKSWKMWPFAVSWTRDPCISPQCGLNCGKNWGTFCEFWGGPLWDREACSRWHCETRELGYNHTKSRYVTRSSSVRTGL